ncbi:MAG: superoxide dismutase family protein [Chloroflexi bacterium]|nr:superoxide dismutase family protein [Chloroflexota bacterium]
MPRLNAPRLIRVLWIGVGIVCGVIFFVAPIFAAPPAQTAQVRTVHTDLRDANKNIVGRATFTQQGSVVQILIVVNDLPPGVHGVHIHEKGKCDAPDFASAGAHFNPENKQHGAQNPNGPHAGDLRNLEVGQNRSGTLDTNNSRIALTPGFPNSILGGDNKALIIHANADDEKTDPIGNSGGRIACGVIGELGPSDWMDHISLALVMALIVASVDAIFITKIIRNRRKARQVARAPRAPEIPVAVSTPARPDKPIVQRDAMVSNLQLEVLTGARRGEVLAIDAPRATIGRARENLIAMTDDENLSRQHAVIELRDTGYFVTNLSQTNGTFVNGVLISASHRLQDGDVIQVGNSRFVVRLKTG